MRTFLIFLFFISFFSYSQEGIADYLLVEKDSTSFYTFTKKGVYLSSFDVNNQIDYKYFSYGKPLPKSLKGVPLNDFSAVNLNDIIYLLYPGGGILYRFYNNIIERIDESFAHRNQFSGFFFGHNSELYLLGGYGYWSAKNYLTKFNFESGSWNIVSVFGEVPKGGINQGSFLKVDSSVFVFDFFSKQPEELSENQNPFLYELTLSDFVWSNKGRLSSHSPISSVEDAIRSVRVKYNNGLFERASLKNAFRIILPANNAVSTYVTDASLSSLSKNSIFIGSRLVYASRNADNLSYTIASIDFNKHAPIKEQALVIDDTVMFEKYLLYSSFFLLAFVIFLYVFFKNRGTLYSLSGLSLFNDKGLLLLTKEELSILILFADSPIVDNNALLELFSDESKSFDAIIKRKNKAIKDLNQRFNAVFKQDLIFKKTDKFDSRQVIYVLDSKTKVLQAESPDSPA